MRNMNNMDTTIKVRMIFLFSFPLYVRYILYANIMSDSKNDKMRHIRDIGKKILIKKNIPIIQHICLFVTAYNPYEQNIAPNKMAA